MSKRDWSLFVVVGVVAAAGLGTWVISNSIRPDLTSPPARPSISISSCRYDEAYREATAARDARDNQPSTATKEDVAKIADEARAAESKEAKAKECEERAHTVLDLEAQWASAVAAQNSTSVASSFYQWASWELFIVALALGAAGWSAYETRKANRIARETSEDQVRAYVLTTNFEVTRIYEKDGSGFQVTPHFDIKNVGQTPAFNVRHTTRFGWMTDEEAEAFVPSQKLDEDGILGPGLSRSVGTAMGNYSKFDLTDGRFVDKRIWIKGVLHFDDATGVRWEHRFCWYLKDPLRLVDSEDVDDPESRAMDFNMTAFTGGNTLRRLDKDEA